ncbi:hypothetical protein COC42_15830 [Sphingomonas spermidinifaciens]|uniref:Uncharacterized protein n=1 Tax=Sphingomonas spermidinifaciens TaxID=1141889 RepID=A0A2A4B0K5_9SPHN|nr:hypothetical protein [Sphingomonas spermidinifaciens]PCD01600.1 hypothetical protein COC42_15830 [Sphingomonas spermidinifaciens]
MAYADHAAPTGVFAAVAASAAAGPIFVASYPLAMGVAAAGGQPGAVHPAGVWIALGIMVVAAPIGMAIAFVPCLIAATLLTPLARRPGVVRLAPVWMIAGAAPIAPLVIVEELGAPEAFALAATAALCALVARQTLLRQLASAD